MGKWADIWSSFPPLHKKRLYQGLAVYVLLMTFTSAWIWLHAEESRQSWLARMPHAEAPVKTVYLTPQITEGSTFNFNTGSEAVPPAKTRGYVSVIMTETGLATALTERALEDLPPEVALAFSPYSPDLKDWIAEARSKDREALVLLPMEPGTYPKDDPGPKALLTRLSDKENANNLAEILAAAEGAIGVMNFMGSRFMLDESKLAPVFTSLREKGALFVENSSAITTIASTLAPQARLPYLAADLRIDDKATDADVRQQLLALEKLALDKGYALGIAQPYPVTFNLLKSWAENLESRGVELVPLSALWKIKQQRSINQPQQSETEPENGEGQPPG